MSNEQKNLDEPKLLDHPLIPPDQFHDKLKVIMSVPKSELEERLAEEKAANADKLKPGPKPKASK